VDTPYILIDLAQLQENIRAMAEFATARGIRLRPHVKAHKIPEIARMQIAAGAAGITVATLGEAEVMFAAGIDDILVAYPLVGAIKLQRARNLLEHGCKLTFLVDSQIGAKALNELSLPGGASVLVKVDSGLGRCGLLPGSGLEDFVRWLSTLPGLKFKGLLTHAGHAYGSRTPEAVATVGRQEGELMVSAAQSLRSKGIAVQEVSIGSTPTARWGGSVPGVTEIRPGNYVFYDATQVALGVARPEQCSLKVRSTVISRPAPRRAIIDAGAKVLALDQGAHGGGAVKGYGLLEKENWVLSRLSEEHGVIEGEGLPEIGEIIDIIPNHACPVINLTDAVQVSDGSTWRVAGRMR
jgi:D-serine deaminase-like pyridoxal phosphate-dependent protein